MARRYRILDVFTDVPFAGNPLAVVLDPEGLDDGAMQAISREFNLSETVFVLPPRDPVNLARLRIFTPTRELPFAGHPTIGTAVLLATLHAPDLIRREEVMLVLEEAIGAVACTVRRREGAGLHARFDAPRQAERLSGPPPDPAELAGLLSLDAEALGCGSHRPSRYSAGVPFTFVPVRSLDQLARARLGGGDGAYYLYTMMADENGSRAVRSRMLAQGLGVAEDPGTGSAALALAGVLLEQDRLPDGDHDCIIRQGVEMGRASRMGLAFTVHEGALVSTTLGGQAVAVAEGVLTS